ncbi:MAG: flagellar biosynthesis protein FlhB [Gammaproteobacteria bacterium]|nr:flagellar biosynthesis protein FlhB [Gammaproteobacteria bacterium]
MADTPAQERTEQPTPKRLEDARKKGQVARSRELTMTIVLLMASSIFVAGGQYWRVSFEKLFQSTLSLDRNALLAEDAMTSALLEGAWHALAVAAPLLLALVAAAIGSTMLVSGWSFSMQALALKWERLNPIKGLGRVFSVKGLVELVKAVLKFFVVLAGSVLAIWLSADHLAGLTNMPFEPALASSFTIVGASFVLLSASLLVIAAVDVPFQLWNHHKELRMTRQEIKDEMKETDGNPEVKGKIRRLQQEVAQRRMMAEVPKADVIITNPTHYAVALKYSETEMGAPVLVAKGVDAVAESIRRVATEHGVVMVSAPPLARSIYFHTELNQMIPEGLYLAVARVLAYVHQVRNKVASPKKAANLIKDLPIPEELRK